jgi:hypothetical protein
MKKPAAKKLPKAKMSRIESRAALNARLKACGAEWYAAKNAGKLPAGTKWPRFWSACNKRLKGGH